MLRQNLNFPVEWIGNQGFLQQMNWLINCDHNSLFWEINPEEGREMAHVI